MDCRTRAKAYSQGMLFTLEPPLPEHLIPEAANFSREERDRAQAAFAEYIKKSGKAAPELMARVIARQVSIETAQMVTSMGHEPLVNANVVLTDGGDYTFNDHLERLRYLDVAPSDEGGKLFKAVLQLAIPGLEHLATEERLSVYLGMMAYNAFGVCFEGGRNDKVNAQSSIVNTRLQCGVYDSYSPRQRQGPRMWRRREHHMVRKGKLELGSISYRPTYVFPCSPFTKLTLISHPSYPAHSLVRSICSAVLQRYI